MQHVIVGQNMAGRVQGTACTVEEEEVVVVWENGMSFAFWVPRAATTAAAKAGPMSSWGQGRAAALRSERRAITWLISSSAISRAYLHRV